MQIHMLKNIKFINRINKYHIAYKKNLYININKMQYIKKKIILIKKFKIINCLRT